MVQRGRIFGISLTGAVPWILAEYAELHFGPRPINPKLGFGLMANPSVAPVTLPVGTRRTVERLIESRVASLVEAAVSQHLSEH